jgi:MoaA/NifB/PqqE/SkfB family radical SAM enzyme
MVSMPPRLRDMTSGLRALMGVVTERRVFAGPRSVALAICEVCNTDCVMCWCHSPLVRRRQAAPRRDPYMDPALLETIIRESRAMGTFRVVLCGNGEPTLHPDFDRMLELMMRLDMQPYVLTNGLAADEARARLWGRMRAHFRFSMQAGDEETWLRVHPSGTAGQFERLSRVIRQLVEAGVPQVSTLHVIHRANVRGVREMVEHARRVGVRDVLFRPARLDEALSEQLLGPQEEARLRADMEECLALAEGYGISTNLREYLDTNLRIRSGRLHTTDLYRKVPCYIGWLYAEFGQDGTMLPCLDSQVVMGLAGTDALRDIWRSPRYREFRHEAHSMPRRGKLVAGCICHACPMYKYNLNVHNLLRLKSLRYSDA